MAGADALTARALNRATLARQGLLDRIVRTDVATSVRRLGSLQAQHPEWPPLALAARAGDRPSADLAAALDLRTVVRSSLMRITIHVVAADDLWPMFAVMRQMRLDQWRLLIKADPVTSPIGKRMAAAHEVAISALRERPRSSLEIDRLMADEVGLEASATTRPAWRQPGVRIVVRTAWRHFAAFVPLVHVPHVGEGYGRSQYAIATDWLGTEMPEIELADARAQVARRYLGAFGPASIDDLVAYVGRGKGGVGVWRDAVAALGDEVVTLHDDAGRTLHDLADAPRPGEDAPAEPRLLARWDSVLLSHATKHRTRVIADRDRPAVFTKNADVLPTFLIDGFVAGTWELARTNGRTRVALHPLRRLSTADRRALLDEAERAVARAEPRGATVEVAFGR